jgi:GTP-binding protein
LGTSVYDYDSKKIIVDILESGQTFVICEGGKGGKGNAFFKSSMNRAPTLHENGDLGEQKKVILKLRYIADVGLVGLPNAGKSSLISQISNVKSKIGSYQFTTLTPKLGVVERNHRKMVFADLPGLIEGATEGKGLGREFLKHIERCLILIHLISISTQDNENLNHAYTIINNELKQYNQVLLDKPIIVVINKIDLPYDVKIIERLQKFINKKVFLISAKTNEGVDQLINELFHIYEELQKKEAAKLLKQKSKVKVIELKQQKDFVKDLKIKQIDAQK